MQPEHAVDDAAVEPANLGETVAHVAANVAMHVARPALRGVSHLYAFPVSLLAGAVLIAAAEGDRAMLAAVVYALAISQMLGISALYHRVQWRGRAYRWMRRLDHCAIFLTMAGTYTAFWLTVLDGRLADTILVVAWLGATLGVIMKLIWIDHPHLLGWIVYTCFGLVGLLVVPQLFATIGTWPTSMLLLGGLCLLLGGVCYAFGRPNPFPDIFGFHEVFHALVLMGIVLQYGAIALYVVR